MTTTPPLPAWASVVVGTQPPHEKLASPSRGRCVGGGGMEGGRAAVAPRQLPRAVNMVVGSMPLTGEAAAGGSGGGGGSSIIDAGGSIVAGATGLLHCTARALSFTGPIS